MSSGDGSILLAENGSVMITAAGNVAVDCGGLPCSVCLGSTPKTITVTFSGVTMCTACGQWHGGDWMRVTGGTINGTFTLTNTPSSPCLYQYHADSGPITLTRYTAEGCSTVAATYQILDIFVFLNQYVINIAVVVSRYGESFAEGRPFNAYIYLPVSYDCMAERTVSNELTECGGPNLAIGYGGSVSITPHA